MKNVRLSASLRTVAGAKEVSVPLASDGSVYELLQAINQSHPALGARLLDDNGQLKPGFQIILNGQHIDWLQGLDTPVADGDDLLLVPPISGG